MLQTSGESPRVLQTGAEQGSELSGSEEFATMALRLLGHIELPPNRAQGGFDHADVHLPSDRLYVAHTSNDAVDVIDMVADRYIESIASLIGVAGALVSEARELVFTSNRGENTVSVFAPGAERNAFKIPVGVKPNGLAFDAARGILIAANVGDPSIPNSYSVSVVDVARRERIAEIGVLGRTRWAIYDAEHEAFFVNIASPALIIAIDARDPGKISKEYEIPVEGPHGLELDAATGRLLCACDAGVLVAVDAVSGRVRGTVPLSGSPDVVFLNSHFGRLYVAIGDPGVVDVIDIRAMRKLEVVPTEAGAHTLAIDRKRNKLYAFLPQTHRAAAFVDST
jgi:DNA-binding beta-propeller fold protein YncE